MYVHGTSWLGTWMSCFGFASSSWAGKAAAKSVPVVNLFINYFTTTLSDILIILKSYLRGFDKGYFSLKCLMEFSSFIDTINMYNVPWKGSLQNSIAWHSAYNKGTSSFISIPYKQWPNSNRNEFLRLTIVSSKNMFHSRSREVWTENKNRREGRGNLRAKQYRSERRIHMRAHAHGRTNTHGGGGLHSTYGRIHRTSDRKQTWLRPGTCWGHLPGASNTPPCWRHRTPRSPPTPNTLSEPLHGGNNSNSLLLLLL